MALMPGYDPWTSGDFHLAGIINTFLLAKIIVSLTDADKWNSIYASGNHNQGNIAEILQDFGYFLPKQGTALDIACGTGINTIFLAKQGLNTHAWDLSEQAIRKLKVEAEHYSLEIHAEVRDVINHPPEKESFDVIVVSHFLDRTIFPSIISALRTEGILFYQTYIQEKTENKGPKNPDYLLAPNELLHLCKDLHILIYREEGKTGRTEQGFRNEAMLIGQRRY